MRIVISTNWAWDIDFWLFMTIFLTNEGPTTYENAILFEANDGFEGFLED